jgi:hypothetical protein
MLTAIYPEHEWIPWKFAKVPKNFWDSKENQRKFLQYTFTELGLKDMEDWYKVSRQVKFST